jgi:hypothetical protein
LIEFDAAKVLGILIGVFLRTWLPARRKAKLATVAGKSWAWRTVYFKTAGVSFFVAVFSAFLIFPAVPQDLSGLLAAFGVAFNYGFGSNAITNEVYELIFGMQNQDGGVQSEGSPAGV